MRSDNSSLWRSYQRLVAQGDSLQAFATALDAARLFEEMRDFRNTGVGIAKLITEFTCALNQHRNLPARLRACETDKQARR